MLFSLFQIDIISLLFGFFSFFSFLLIEILTYFFGSILAFADVAIPYQLGFQDPATEFVEGIIDLHHDVFGYLVFICIFVFYMVSSTVFIFRAHNNPHPPFDLRHHTMIEVI